MGNYGDWKLISRELILAVDELCVQEGALPLITSGTEGKHSPKSFHYKGEALDLMFYNVKLWELPRIFEAARKSPALTGVGIYSEWRFSKNISPSGGLHLERDSTATLPVEKKKIWVRTADGDFGATPEVINKYFSAKRV
jgi:hypothetical protein